MSVPPSGVETRCVCMDDPNSDPDVLLMLRVKEGDLEAFDQLARKYQTVLVNFFLRMGVYSHCEDLTQETLVRIFRSRRKFRPRAKFRTWMYTIARNIWIDHLRRSARERKRLEILSTHQEVESQPERMAGLDERQILLQRAVERLPEKLRLVVVMSHFQQIPHAEIAETLGIPPGTVKSRLHLANQKLREWMGE